jgi:hypothetical protein
MRLVGYGRLEGDDGGGDGDDIVNYFQLGEVGSGIGLLY